VEVDNFTVHIWSASKLKGEGMVVRSLVGNQAGTSISKESNHQVDIETILLQSWNALTYVSKRNHTKPEEPL